MWRGRRLPANVLWRGTIFELADQAMMKFPLVEAIPSSRALTQILADFQAWRLAEETTVLSTRFISLQPPRCS